MSTADNVTKINARTEYENEMRDLVSKAFSELDKIEDEIKALRDDKSAVWASLVAKGFNKKGLNQAYKYQNMNEKDKENYDTSMFYGRSLIDHPVNRDLFEAEDSLAMALKNANEAKDAIEVEED